MPARTNMDGQRRSLFLLLLLLLLLVADAVAVAAAIPSVGAGPLPLEMAPCSTSSCGHGVSTRDTATGGCRCHCSAGYLLPQCLYTARDPAVPMGLWLRPKARVNPPPRLLPDVLLDELCSELLGKEQAPAFRSQVRFLYGLPSRLLQPEQAVEIAVREDEVFVALQVPGWMAQLLLAAAAQPLNTTHLGGFAVTAVEDLQPSPVQIRPYASEWMRFFYSSNNTAYGGYPGWSVGFPQVSWAVGAGLLVLVVVAVEKVCLFNTERHVGEAAVIVGVHVGQQDFGSEPPPPQVEDLRRYRSRSGVQRSRSRSRSVVGRGPEGEALLGEQQDAHDTGPLDFTNEAAEAAVK